MSICIHLVYASLFSVWRPFQIFKCSFASIVLSIFRSLNKLLMKSLGEQWHVWCFLVLSCTHGTIMGYWQLIMHGIFFFFPLNRKYAVLVFLFFVFGDILWLRFPITNQQINKPLISVLLAGILWKFYWFRIRRWRRTRHFRFFPCFLFKHFLFWLLKETGW